MGFAAAVIALALGAPVPASALTVEVRPLPPLERMIGEMLMLGFDGLRPSDPDVRRTARTLAEGRIGGVVLMDRNVRSPSQVKALTETFRRAGGDPPPLIAIDQEGGNVQRLSASKGFSSYPTARRVATRDPFAAYALYQAMAGELAEAGINLNLGPVVDLSRNARNHVINRRGRSFGDDPRRVTLYARMFIAAHREAGVLTSLKHFPGHGSSLADSHNVFVDISASWDETELAPYEALAAADAIDTVMVGHLYHPAFSGRRLPATLDAGAVQGWLRDRLGFAGVVITDDMRMGAINRYHSLQTGAVKAVAAGNDILLYCNPRKGEDLAGAVTAAIAKAVNEGRIPYTRVIQSWDRIEALKARLPMPEPVATEEGLGDAPAARAHEAALVGAAPTVID